ncbi:hypothetical protein ACIQF6_28810 [Kitasatospora sp. NPDC092948]|uniref:hypothetical protein n=1 Tax=Kitasatospora sp. NPDC092948 TaxID=3364088 RepID=UPI003821EB99
MPLPHSPAGQSYARPNAAEVAWALDAADAARSDGALGGHRAARTACAILAAAVWDELTGFDPQVPFDAVGLELVLDAFGEVMTTGHLWRADGSEFAIVDGVWLHDVCEWTSLLTDDNASAWSPLCSPLPPLAPGLSRFRLDLVRAAQSE